MLCRLEYMRTPETHERIRVILSHKIDEDVIFSLKKDIITIVSFTQGLELAEDSVRLLIFCLGSTTHYLIGLVRSHLRRFPEKLFVSFRTERVDFKLKVFLCEKRSHLLF
eukprot:766607-Hanusia_phi.AAC.2